VHDVLMNPQHPYTRGMLSSTVKDQARDKPLEAIPGTPPDLRALPPGCSFAPRCRYAMPECLTAMPEPVADNDQHMTRCLRVGVDNGELRLRDRQLVSA
jgi:peptide/nickel transport system ATP-binding protein